MGKTSIMNRICGLEFQPYEKPTIGTKLVQHLLGKMVVEVWDVVGQHSQFGSVKAKARRADILFAVYDVSSKDSLLVLGERLTEIVRNGALCVIENVWAVTVCDRGATVDFNCFVRKQSGCRRSLETSITKNTTHPIHITPCRYNLFLKVCVIICGVVVFDRSRHKKAYCSLESIHAARSSRRQLKLDTMSMRLWLTLC